MVKLLKSGPMDLWDPRVTLIELPMAKYPATNRAPTVIQESLMILFAKFSYISVCQD